MKLLVQLLLTWLFIIASSTAAAAEQPRKRIALTFDDAPLPDGPFFEGAERTRRLIAALKEADVPQAAIFVTTGNIKDSAGEARIRAYAAAGHLLGNHSHSHKWLKDMDAAAYLADIDRASRRLARFNNVRPWFRYPFLNESPDAARRDAVRAGLARRKLMNAYVTVDTWDWAIVNLAREAKQAGRDIDMDALRQMYLDVMLNAVDTYDKLALEALGRSPAHVLLAHENDLQALFIGDLVKALRARGWTIVSPDEAFSDPIARVLPNTLRNGNGRVAALAAVRGFEPERLRDRFHDEKLLKQMFEQRVIRSAAR
ncbi:MAG: polysaccharide deacetylase family protein [Pseudomonadota bacterium]|nr:polysaccharide deacetylase family protein [Pseudomonadota bacterium]